MNALEALSRFPFSDSLSESARQALREQATVKMVAPHTPLLQKGEECGGAFLVTYGTIRVFYIDKRGRQGTLYRVATGEACFLSLECAMHGTPYPAWAESDGEPTQFIRIPTQLYVALYEAEAAFQRFAYLSLSSRILQLMAVLEESATLAIEQRTAALLLDLADGEGQVTSSQARLAENLGSAREVVARTLRTFRNGGLVETRRGTVRILDKLRLLKLAGRGQFQ
jgi:CRP/FNR family transcriptional regulator